jgi:hypothetical protein
LKVCHPKELENPVLLDEAAVPSTKYGMALTLNVIFDGKLHSINVFIICKIVKSDNSIEISVQATRGLNEFIGLSVLILQSE